MKKNTGSGMTTEVYYLRLLNKTMAIRDGGRKRIPQLLGDGITQVKNRKFIKLEYLEHSLDQYLTGDTIETNQ